MLSCSSLSNEASINDFGLLIAYVFPGFTALWAATFVTDSLNPWIGRSAPDAPTVGGFLYMTVAAVAAGMAVSTMRWMVLDTIHHRTGITPPQWDFALLGERVAAFGLVVDHYYRYYQAAANMVVSLALVLVARRWSMGRFSARPDVADLGILVLMVIFFLGSRDSLRRYYSRGGQLLGKQSGHGGGERDRAGGHEESAVKASAPPTTP